MLSKFDDYCIHQTSNPIAHPSDSDLNFYDRYWFNGFNREGTVYFGVGFAIYPNRFVMDGHFSIVMDGKQYCFHSSRRAPFDRSETNIGPLSIEVINPMREVRIRLKPNDTGIEADLHFKARTYATQEPQSRMTEDNHLIMDTCRFTQFGCWQGTISVDGRKEEFGFDDFLGTRDKSWGIRPVGEPRGGAPAASGNMGVYWCWAPIQFDSFCTHFGTFEDPDGNATQLSGSKIPVYVNVNDIPTGPEPDLVEMKTMTHRINWEKGSRRPQSARLNFHSIAGEEINIELESVALFQMLGLGYLHPEWSQGIWKGEELIEREEWVLKDLDPLDYKHIHIQQMVKAKLGDHIGYGTLETLVFGSHAPSNFTDFLDGAK